MTNDMNDIKDNIEGRTNDVGVCQDTKEYFSSRIKEATLTKKKSATNMTTKSTLWGIHTKNNKNTHTQQNSWKEKETEILHPQDKEA